MRDDLSFQKGQNILQLQNFSLTMVSLQMYTLEYFFLELHLLKINFIDILLDRCELTRWQKNGQ